MRVLNVDTKEITDLQWEPGKFFSPQNGYEHVDELRDTLFTALSPLENAIGMSAGEHKELLKSALKSVQSVMKELE